MDMSKLKIFKFVLSNRFNPSLTYKGEKQNKIGYFFQFIFILITLTLICGCSHFNEGLQTKSTFEEANVFFSQGEYGASLNKYKQIIEKYPTTGDRVLFEMGIIYAHPKNEQKDYQKSLECFQELIRDFPESSYRQDSEMMIFYLNNVTLKNSLITTQKTQIENLQQEIRSKNNEVITLQNEIITLKKQIETLEQKVFSYAIQIGPADKILIEKRERRLTLI
jgi:tetratricopeptide (TPR) repeat protein